LFTANSALLSSRGVKWRCAAVLSLALVAALSLTGRAGEGTSGIAVLELLPLGEHWFTQNAGPPSVIPGPGQIAVVGLLDDPTLAVRDIRHIALYAPDGEPRQLTIESQSIFRDLGHIVSLRCSFLANESEVTSDKPFTIIWGPEIQAEHAQVARLTLDLEQRERYREFRWRREDGTAASDATVASVEVIADSSAAYHFLWYLLPMAAILTLLTVRKFLARNPGNSTRP